MALPILDGNQTSTTLATTVSGGAHYPNHILASAVTISSLPAISGTVTANVYKGQFVKCVIVNDYVRGTFYFERIGDRHWAAGNNIGETSDLDIVGDSSGWIVSSQNEGGIATFAGNTNLPPTSGWTLNGNTTSFVLSYDQPTIQSISGTVTVGNSVTIGSLPVQLSTTTIGGTARLNVTLSSATTVGGTAPSYANLYGGSDGTNLRSILVDSSGRTTVTGSVSVANLPSTQTVAGTVTANISGTVPVSGTFWQATQPVSGTVTANISGTSTVTGSVSILGTPSVTMGAISGTVTANISGTVPVSISSVTIGNTVTVAGTVTANVASTTVTVSALPSGALTTRFGSVTTANTAQITTAVTNTSRKYLLAQNISTGTVTIGIGFSPTTTQGIQLTAGAGLTFDSFVPTGAVYWLGATTGATWTILEG